ncbi:hypothetical protein BDU57DRAFT_578760 [Ampelomyces quisqualis]|uniref:Uncharacterized protein n=1 Tax=Ampelomyces quisqualis TaxID=50730 RepID=A0A6A5QGE9_AMPQU|nr:hypothetical protein BDU57DRAFT_578760 [Ampelomyces quisqualis]
MSSSHAEKPADPVSDTESESDVDSSSEASHEPQRETTFEDVNDVSERPGKLAHEGEHEAKRAAGIQFSDQTDHKGTWEKYRKKKRSVAKWAQAIWPADEGFEIQAKISREARVKNKTWYYKAAICDLKTNEELLKCSKTSQSRQTVLNALVEDLRAKLNEQDPETSKVLERSKKEKRNSSGSAKRKKDKKLIVPINLLKYLAADGRK